MRQSIRIIEQCISLIFLGPIKNPNLKYGSLTREEMKSSMEATIHHLKFFTEGFTLLPGETYIATKCPKGEFGVYLVSNTTD